MTSFRTDRVEMTKYGTRNSNDMRSPLVGCQSSLGPTRDQDFADRLTRELDQMGVKIVIKLDADGVWSLQVPKGRCTLKYYGFGEWNLVAVGVGSPERTNRGVLVKFCTADILHNRAPSCSDPQKVAELVAGEILNISGKVDIGF